MKKLITPLLAAVVMLTGCAFHGGYMGSSASLSSANYSYTNRHLTGTSKATYFLGIGGLARTALVDEAKEDMLKRTQLSDNQALANITVNFKSASYVIVNQVTCTVTADVVEFNN